MTNAGYVIGQLKMKINDLSKGANFLQYAQVDQPPARVAGTSVTFIYAAVIRGLLYPDPDRTGGPVEGYSQYILRLVGTTYTAWSSAGVSYKAGDRRTSGELLYTCILDHTSSAENQPGTAGGESYWTLSTEITALPMGQEYVLGTHSTTYYAQAPDMRHFVPWYQAGAIVPLVKKGNHYFFVNTLMRTIKVDESSIQTVRWNDTDHRIMSVFG